MGLVVVFFRVKGREERKEGSKDATGERLDYVLQTQ